MTPISDDLIEVRLTINPELLKSFVKILEALSAVFIKAKKQETLSRLIQKEKEPEEKAKCEAILARRKRLCIEAYMKALKSGLEPKKAISEANKTLQAQGHNWSSYYNVTEIVRKAGLLRGTNFYKRKVRKEK